MPRSRSNTSDDAWRDPDDAPDWTPETFDAAEMRDGAIVLRTASGGLGRGRPKLVAPKVRVTLRLDADLIGKLREGGAGWQTRANALLRKATGV